MENVDVAIIRPPDSLAGVLQVRREVFSKEQGIDESLDKDGLDEQAEHILATANGYPVGAARIRYLDTETAKIERVAVLSHLRGLDIGRKIMDKLEERLREKHIKKAVMDAQVSAQGFYEKLGYLTDGPVFEEVGIPHIKMYKILKESTQ